MNKVEIKLDIDLMNDALYDKLLDAFWEQAERQGLDPDDYLFDEWVVSCKAVKL
jgi:hypothetical protein